MISKTRIVRLLAVAVTLAAVTLLLARVHFGVGSWGDEPYGLSTSLRYVLGDRPLVDSWDTNFSSAIMAMPFVSGYLTLARSTDAMLLAFRYVWVALVLTTSFASFVVLRRIAPSWIAFAIAVLLLLYFPFLSPWVGYGADWSWHMLAAVAAVGLQLMAPRRPWVFALPGVLSAIGIVGNPPTLTVLPFFAWAIWLTYRSDPVVRRQCASWYLASATLVLLSFALLLRILAGPELLSALPYIASPDDHDFSLAAQSNRLWRARWTLVIPIAVGLAVGLWQRRRRVSPHTAFSAAVLGALSAGVAGTFTSRISLLSAPQELVFVCAAAVFISFVTAGDVRMTGDQLLLTMTATGAGIGWFLGSNGGVSTGVLASPLLFAASLLWLRSGMKPHGLMRRGSAFTATALLITIVASIGLSFTPEGITTEMGTTVKSGPFKGIRTTASEALLVERIQNDLGRLEPIEGRTLFLERFPLGYLLIGDSRPGTYSTWATSAESDRLQRYIDITGNAPDRIVLTRFRSDFSASGFPTTVNLDDVEEYRTILCGSELQVLDRIGQVRP